MRQKAKHKSSMHFEKCCTYSSIAKKHKKSVYSTSCAQVEGKESKVQINQKQQQLRQFITRKETLS